MNKILRISIVVVICLIVILGVALLIGQCSKKPEETTTTTPTTSTTSSTTSNTNNPLDCTEHVDADNNYVCDNCGEEITSSYTETNDKVYVIPAQLNLRKTPDATGTATASVFMDDELDRLGYYAEGWSKVVYDGEEYYVLTELITTQKPIADSEFTTVDETVYFTQNAFSYTKPSYIEGYSEKIDTFFKGDSVKRTGVATRAFVDTDGTEYTFARIEYTVKVEGVDTLVVRYVNNEYLTTEAPINPDGDIVFEACDVTLKVIAETSIAIRKTALWIDGDSEFNNAQIAGHAYTGDILTATHKGVEDDGTVWYKVVIDDTTYYVIYKDVNLEIQTPAE